MCGIIGSNFKSNKFQIALEMLSHRGPDNSSILEYKNIQLGHTRLSIIDLNDEANQPMEFDNLIITFNGEIYNYRELILEEKLLCKTKSDTEVIIRLYQKYGKDFLNKLNGMFAFCIYDKIKDRYFCARDRFGKKPFFYYFKDGKFIFASEIKSILEILDKKPSLNIDALSEYLSFLTPIGSSTFYNDIQKLQASNYLILEKRNIKIDKFFSLDNIKTKYFEEDTALKDIEQLLIKSVEQRLVSDVEVGTLLSGGIDSSLISAIYAKLSKNTINSFCVGYDEHKQYNEFKYADKVAKYIDANHTNITITKKDFISTIDEMLLHTDEPFGDTASIPTFLLSKHIHKKGIKTVLSGEGSDEIFLGYNLYKKLLPLYNKNASNEEFNLTKDWEYNRRILDNEAIYQSLGETFTESQKNLLFKNYTKKYRLKDYSNNYEAIKWFSYIDLKIWISDVLMTKVDRMSMAHSLEVRTPFLDFELVEYLMAVEPQIKLGDKSKYLLKKIAKNYLPVDIINRPKQGFGLPYLEWLYDEYGEEILHTILRVNKTLNIFEIEFVNFLYFEAKENRFKQHLWNLFIFSRWFEKHYM